MAETADMKKLRHCRPMYYPCLPHRLSQVTGITY